ncbi:MULTISPECIES: hypothetical protein [unclassified Streptomyces]|uniref:Uncharacterized protein n=1 Tax=Streptomyces sp. R33 TaxID=3238629 RepID=A0AB39Y195_9ACTN|nr:MULTISPECIES: hypothetical protein [unclassified Streptomyces]TDU74132.1 hypothetical protein EDD91_0769 [Streptomyces sp. KS 21]
MNPHSERLDAVQERAFETMRAELPGSVPMLDPEARQERSAR